VAIVAAQVLQISQLDHPIRAALQPEKHICRLIIQGIKKRHPKNTGNSLGSQLSLRGDQKKTGDAGCFTSSTPGGPNFESCSVS
jgi:hypothetical protein